MFKEISHLKKEKNAIILAHYYQDADIQDIADYIGDSLGLAQQAEKPDIILFAGCTFYGRNCKNFESKNKSFNSDLNTRLHFLNLPTKTNFAAFKAAHPDHIVLTYINCTF